MIIIFTDGSSKGNPGPGGWGAIIASDNSQLSISNFQNKVVELGGYEKLTTNNRMELTAVIKALDFISKLTKQTDKPEITIHTDSEYIVKGVTVWVKGWQQNNWRTSARKPVLNQDLWQELVQAIEGKDIKWVVIKGHSGVSANERCDVIATIYADGDRINLYNGPRKDYDVSFSLRPAFI